MNLVDAFPVARLRRRVRLWSALAGATGTEGARTRPRARALVTALLASALPASVLATAAAVPVAAAPAAPVAGTGAARDAPEVPPVTPAVDRVHYDVSIEGIDGGTSGRAYGAFLRGAKGFAWGQDGWCEDVGPGHTEVIWVVASAYGDPVIWRTTCDDTVADYGKADPTLPPRPDSITIAVCKRLARGSRAPCSTQSFGILPKGWAPGRAASTGS